MSPNAGAGGGGVVGSQPMITAVNRSPNKLWISNFVYAFIGPEKKDFICRWISAGFYAAFSFACVPTGIAELMLQ
jgi:hypothetical protein